MCTYVISALRESLCCRFAALLCSLFHCGVSVFAYYYISTSRERDDLLFERLFLHLMFSSSESHAQTLSKVTQYSLKQG